MCISPTEPLWYVAAEFTLVLDKICSVSFTSLFTTTNCNSSTFSANEFFFLEVGVIVSCLITCFPSTKVWVFTFETFIIGKGTHSIFLQVVIVRITNFFKSWFLMQIFKFCPFHSFWNDNFLNFNSFLNFFVERRTLFCINSLFTIWAIKIIEDYTRTIVSIHNILLKATNMENMSASKLNTWLLSKCGAVTNSAELRFVDIRFHVSLHFCNTLIFKTWHALLFSSGSKTCVTTGQNFITRLLHNVEAITLSTHISECWFHTWRWLLEFFFTESATFVIGLSTKLSQVIWFSVATSTEILLTFRASNSMICHVLSSICTYQITFVVFKSFLNITWHEFHNVSTGTTHKIWIQFNDL